MTLAHSADRAGISAMSMARLAMSRGSRPCSRKKGLWPVEADTDVFIAHKIGGRRSSQPEWCCSSLILQVSIVSSD